MRFGLRIRGVVLLTGLVLDSSSVTSALVDVVVSVDFLPRYFDAAVATTVPLSFDLVIDVFAVCFDYVFFSLICFSHERINVERLLRFYVEVVGIKYEI